MARPRMNPVGTNNEVFSLWPSTMEIVRAWMTTHDISKSDALRAILMAAPEPNTRNARRATQSLRRAQTATTQASLAQAGSLSAVTLEQRRAKRAAEARQRRALEKRRRMGLKNETE